VAKELALVPDHIAQVAVWQHLKVRKAMAVAMSKISCVMLEAT